ncbi:glycine/D-amino acid oxidase-like deaminating enzyme [Bradyrhizobium sp. USDA 4459]
MSPRVERIHSDERVPAEADVVIVGGGILGATAAYYLAKRGVSVALLEKGHVACEQSSRNWGWCRQQNRDRRELPLSVLSMRLWDELTRDINRDLGFRRCGLVYATHDEAVLAGWEKWREVAREYDVDTRVLSRAEVAERVPEARDKWVGGTYSERDGKAEPALAAPGIADGARVLGATIHQGCAARALDLANGNIAGVHTEKGYIRTSAVLCAAGAWSSRFLRPLGIRFPQASIRQTALRSTPTINIGEAVSTPYCTITRRLDGSYTLAISGKANLEITPQALRYSREFMPQFLRRLKNVRLGVGRSFVSGPDSLPALLTNDDRIFEQNRVLDPPPFEMADEPSGGERPEDLPPTRRNKDRQRLGRLRRLHAGCSACGIAGGRGEGPRPRGGLLGPRLRPGPGTRLSCRTACRQRHAVRRSHTVPAVASGRWLQAGHLRHLKIEPEVRPDARQAARDRSSRLGAKLDGKFGPLDRGGHYGDATPVSSPGINWRAVGAGSQA